MPVLNYYVPTCPHFSRAYMLTCLYIFFVPTCLRAYVRSFFTYLRAYNHSQYILRLTSFKLGYSLRSYTNLFANEILTYFIVFFRFIKVVQLELYIGSFKYLDIYLLKLNKRHARKRCGMYSALIIKIPESSFHEGFYLYDTGF